MSNTVSVDIGQLIVGREMAFPVVDPDGVLLLAAGIPLTRELKQRLRDRGIQEVVIDEADVVHTTLNAEIARAGSQEGAFHESVNQTLDRLIRSGRLAVVNMGPPVRHKVVDHGRKPYDPDFQKRLIEQHDKTTCSVDRLMREVVRGEHITGHETGSLARNYVHDLVADLANTLSVGFLQNEDPSLARHAVSTAILAMAMGIELGLDEDNLVKIGITGLVQDWGMALVPREIREARRPLTAVEFLEIQKHPTQTVELLERLHGIPNLVKLVALQVHERPDGSGYPRGREGRSIHLFARILHVADAYTAMTSSRPHRPPLMPYTAMERLLQQAGRWQVDPAVVRTLLHVLSLFPIGSFVTLSDGSVAQVLRANGKEFTRPIVQRVQAADGSPVHPGEDSTVIDLAASELSVVQALPLAASHEMRTFGGTGPNFDGAGRKAMQPVG